METVVICSKLHIGDNLKALVKNFEDNLDKNIKYTLKSSTEKVFTDKNGDNILQIVVEWKMDENII